MKKEYSKPDIMFESFSLSTDIAAGCTKVIDTFRGGSCGLDIGGGLMLFLADVNGCSFPAEDDGKHDGICYHVPMADSKLFNS